jgi:hypothetical protein
LKYVDNVNAILRRKVWFDEFGMLIAITCDKQTAWKGPRFNGENGIAM